MTVLVDTSVWVDYLRSATGAAGDALDRRIDAGTAATTDAVLLEVLAGPTSERAAGRHAKMLAGCEHLAQESPTDAVQAAALYRACRRGGETPRSQLDCLIAAVAVRHGIPVLHRDRDFDVIARHTPLQVVTA